ILAMSFNPHLGVAREPIVCKLQIGFERPCSIRMPQRDGHVVTRDLPTSRVVKCPLHFRPSLHWHAPPSRVWYQNRKFQIGNWTCVSQVPKSSHRRATRQRRLPVLVAKAAE